MRSQKAMESKSGVSEMRLPKLFRKDNPAYRSIFAAIGRMPGPVWRTVDYAAFINEGFIKCAPVHACVSMVAKAGSGVDWTLMQRDKELETHELLSLLARPNKYEAGPRFTEMVFLYLLVAGNSYIYRNSGVNSAPPKSLYWLRPDRMTVIKSGDWKNPIKGYEYSAGAKPELLDEELVLHLKEPHLGNDWEGLSRVQVAAHEIDTWNESMQWNMKLLQNDMRIPGLLTGKNIQPQAVQTLKSMFKENYQGANSADFASPLIMSGEDLEWTDLTRAAKDSDWSEGQKRVLRSICSVFGVPAQLLGDAESTTYANYQEARKSFWIETVMPLLDFYRDELNNWLVPLYGDGLRLDYDRDSIDALQEDRAQQYAYLESARFLKLNEKRAATGYDDVPEGEVIMVGMGDMPLSDAVAPAGDLSAQDEPKSFKPCQTKSLGSFWRGENERKALWRNYERRVVAKERAFRREVHAWLKGQADAIVSKFDAGVSYPEDMFDKQAAMASYKDRLTKRYTALYATARDAGLAHSEGKLYEFEDAKSTKALTDAARKKLEKIIEETSDFITDETLGEVQQAMMTALDENLTTAETSSLLRELLGTMTPTRARRIARTETAMIENCGSLDGYREAGMGGKGWACTFVEHSRDEHKDADGQEVGIDEPFILNGPNGPKEMQYPGDRSHLGAGDGYYTINCLCYHYPIGD